MAQKESLSKKKRDHRESKHQHGGGGKVYHEVWETQKYNVVDEKGITNTRHRSVLVRRRGLSPIDAILIGGGRGFQALGGKGRSTKRSEKAISKASASNPRKEAKRAKRGEKSDG